MPDSLGPVAPGSQHRNEAAAVASEGSPITSPGLGRMQSQPGTERAEGTADSAGKAETSQLMAGHEPRDRDG